MSHTTELLAARALAVCLAKPMPPHAGRQHNALVHSLGVLRHTDPSHQRVSSAATLSLV